MGRRHASVVARQRRTENLDRIILPANDRLACNGPCDGVSGELYNPPDINELSLPFAFKVLSRSRLVGATPNPQTDRYRKTPLAPDRFPATRIPSANAPSPPPTSDRPCHPLLTPPPAP